MVRHATVVLGTRPEGIKLAPVIHELKRRDWGLNIISTGQHKELLDDVLETFDIVPHYHLNLMRADQDAGVFLGRAIQDISEKLIDAFVKTQIMIVQGDTASALAGALAAFYQGIPIAHVEAGLRTNDLDSPRPEEANRVIIDRIGDFLFAPTDDAEWSCDSERKTDSGNPVIQITGNTGIDALLYAAEKSTVAEWSRQAPILLVTMHRRENFSRIRDVLNGVVRALNCASNPFHAIFTVHPNPNVQKIARSFMKLQGDVPLELIPPQPYLKFIGLMRASSLILTDSGGIQEEAPSLGKRVLIARDSTERVEGVEAGTSMLVPLTEEGITEAICKWIHEPSPQAKNPFGDGQAAQRIVDTLEEHFEP